MNTTNSKTPCSRLAVQPVPQPNANEMKLVRAPRTRRATCTHGRGWRLPSTTYWWSVAAGALLLLAKLNGSMGGCIDDPCKFPSLGYPLTHSPSHYHWRDDARCTFCEPCYGYNPTCWQAWPSGCVGCPPLADHGYMVPAVSSGVLGNPDAGLPGHPVLGVAAPDQPGGAPDGSGPVRCPAKSRRPFHPAEAAAQCSNCCRRRRSRSRRPSRRRPLRRRQLSRRRRPACRRRLSCPPQR